MTRNGKVLNCKAEELVVGDIIDVKFGDRVPADVRVITAHGFKVFFAVANLRNVSECLRGIDTTLI